jgi:F-type H+-transporting ATPase subunit b
MERDNMLKDAREIKEKMIADSKDEAQVEND